MTPLPWPASSGSTWMIEGPPDAGAGLAAGSAAGRRRRRAAAARAGLRRRRRRRRRVAERLVAQGDGAETPTRHERRQATSQSDGPARPADRPRPTARDWPSGRSISLADCVKPRPCRSGCPSGKSAGTSRSRQTYALPNVRGRRVLDGRRLARRSTGCMTALSGFGGKAGSVFSPRSRSSA